MEQNSDNIPLVVSYETDLSDNVNAQVFKKTLEKHRWDYKFIGEGIKWTNFKDKIVGYYNFLETLPENKVVVLSDARDVFCLRDSVLFMEKINNIIDTKIIISAETFLLGHMNWTKEQMEKEISKDPNFFYQGVPLDKYWLYYNKTNEIPFRKYVNSGLIVSRVKNLKTALKWILDNNYVDDQLGFANYANHFPQLMFLDYDANILHTSTGFVNGCLYNHDIQMKDAPTFTELFGMSSYFLHIPGHVISKGQKYIYDVIYKLQKFDIIDKDIYSTYGFTIKNNRHKFIITNDN